MLDKVYIEKPMGPGFTRREFECKRGDLTIRGTEYKPDGENLPIAIVSHGFLCWQDTVREYTQLLATLGYCAYCYDFCGGSIPGKSKSDGENTDMTPMTEVEDLEAVIAYARSLPYTGDTVLLAGASQGGFVSAYTAAKPENKIDKLVLFYPAFCIPDDARAGSMLHAKFDPANIPEIIDCGPIKLGGCYPASVIDRDFTKDIATYEGPVAIIHGTNDVIVHVDYAYRAFNAYEGSKPGRAVLHVIGNGDHGFEGAHDDMAKDYLTSFAKF